MLQQRFGRLACSVCEQHRIRGTGGSRLVWNTVCDSMPIGQQGGRTILIATVWLAAAKGLTSLCMTAGWWYPVNMPDQSSRKFTPRLLSRTTPNTKPKAMNQADPEKRFTALLRIAKIRTNPLTLRDVSLLIKAAEKPVEETPHAIALARRAKGRPPLLVKYSDISGLLLSPTGEKLLNRLSKAGLITKARLLINQHYIMDNTPLEQVAEDLGTSLRRILNLHMALPTHQQNPDAMNEAKEHIKNFESYKAKQKRKTT